MPVTESLRRSVAFLLSATCLGGLLLMWGCDPTVQVVDPSDQYRFSIFGALNVAADTQAIRVEPLGDTTQLGAPPDINATVTLENLDTGTEVPLRDSFVAVGSGSNRVHNFWTTHPVQPATSYRIAVHQGGETVTTATTVTPERAPELSQRANFYLPCEFPPSHSNDPYRAQNTFSVLARNVDRIAAAHVIYPITLDFPGQDPIHTLNDFDHSDSVEELGMDAGFEIFFFYRKELVNLNPNPPPGPSLECVSKDNFTHPYAMVAIAAGGPDWPEWRSLPLDQVARPDSFSNVQGGHGFFGGVYSDTIKIPIQDRPS